MAVELASICEDETDSSQKNIRIDRNNGDCHDFDLHNVYSSDRNKSLTQVQNPQIYQTRAKQYTYFDHHILRNKYVFCVHRYKLPAFHIMLTDNHTIADIFAKIKTEIIVQSYKSSNNPFKKNKDKSVLRDFQDDIPSNSDNDLIDLFMFNSITNEIKIMPYGSYTLRSFVNLNSELFSSENTKNVRTQFGNLVYSLYYLDTEAVQRIQIEQNSFTNRTINYMKRVIGKIIPTNLCR
jgi:hypothetical protein